MGILWAHTGAKGCIVLKHRQQVVPSADTSSEREDTTNGQTDTTRTDQLTRVKSHKDRSMEHGGTGSGTDLTVNASTNGNSPIRSDKWEFPYKALTCIPQPTPHGLHQKLSQPEPFTYNSQL